MKKTRFTETQIVKAIQEHENGRDAKGEVTFEFDTDDCVSYIEYITNPNRRETFWGYLKEKSLTTNSYKYEDLDNKS